MGPMRYATYLKDGTEHAGVFHGRTLYSLDDALHQVDRALAGTLQTFIGRAAEDAALVPALAAVDFARLTPVEGAPLCAPIPRPARNIFCLGKNYAAHATEVKATRLSGSGIPKAPVYFTKTAAPALTPGGIINCPLALTKALDYEAELAVVLGRAGRDIPAAEAEQYVFGYTILNDISARDLQAEHEQWFKGKNLDTFCPMGPVLVGREEFAFPPALDIRCRVNGEERQHADTSMLLFGIPAILADLSKGSTLLPGDIISTGTPAGVGAGFDPPRFLRDGDMVECEIEDIGVLKNTVRRK